MKSFIKFLVRHIPRPWLIRFSYVFSIFFRLFYAGNKHECPVCGGRFRKLMPYGNQGLSNRLCPKCLSLERHRLLWLYFKDHTDFFSANIKMLHIAPEQCFLKRFKKIETLQYTTADLESPLADIHFDIREIPLEDNTYDFVMANHVMEHIDDDIKAMKEVYRIIKPGGFAILQVPLDYNRTETYEDASIVDRAEREKVFGQYDHLRVYGTDYPKKLEQAGFFVEEINLPAIFKQETIERFRLPQTEIIYKAIKK